MTKEKTAVDWLYQWFNDNFEATIGESINALNHAKAIEKQQIVDAWGDGNLSDTTLINQTEQAEQYFQNKFEQ
jgi:hypothetical protein